jgi:hypothetical protein
VGPDFLAFRSAQAGDFRRVWMTPGDIVLPDTMLMQLLVYQSGPLSSWYLSKQIAVAINLFDLID